MIDELKGVHVALITPFAPDGSLDEPAFVALIEDQLAAGMSGLLVGGGTGEGLALTEKELGVLLSLATQTVQGGVPITMQIAAISTADAMRNAERALAAGAQIGLLLPPFGEAVSDEELIGHFARVAEVGLPIMIYNSPGIGNEIEPEMVRRLAEIEGVDYLKDSTSEPDRLADIARLTEGTLQVLHGKDSLALAGFLSGIRGSFWGAPNATPQACVRLYQLASLEGDVEAARRLWSSFYPVLRFFETEGYMAPIKAALELRGLVAGSPRLPLLPLSDSKRTVLAKLLAQLDQTLANES